MFSFCICDDDKTVIQETKEMIKRYDNKKGFVFSIHTYEDSSRLAEDLSNGATFEFYLLDILMPLTSGLDIAQMIREKDTKAHIIFLTSSPEFALESYEYHADHYLLKPIEEEKLYRVLDFLISKLPREKNKLLTIASKNTSRTIEFDSICYIESRRNKVSFTLNTQDTFELYSTFTEMEQQFTDHPAFVRIHRSYIINMHYIREVSKNTIVLSTGQQLPLSASYTESFKSTYFSFVENLAHF